MKKIDLKKNLSYEPITISGKLFKLQNVYGHVQVCLSVKYLRRYNYLLGKSHSIISGQAIITIAISKASL